MDDFLWFMHVLIYCFTGTLQIGAEVFSQNALVIIAAGTGFMICITMLLKLLGRILFNAIGVIILVIATEIAYHAIAGG